MNSEMSHRSDSPPPPSAAIAIDQKKLSYSILWKYGEKTRDDSIEITKGDNKVVTLCRWTTFKSFHFPEGAVVVGFRGRRDYKDGKCEGVMCCKWSSQEKEFPFYIFTMSNGYNGTFSEKDFESIELVSQTEFTHFNPDAIKNLKSKLR